MENQLTASSPASADPSRFGIRVEFDDPHEGPQKGTLIGILNSPEAPATAVILVDHSLEGVTWNVPLRDVKFMGDAASMSPVTHHTNPVSGSGWQTEFNHAGIWYPTGSGIASFGVAWDALAILAKSDGETPVERRIVKFVD
jgi:hypothetical protein